MGVADGLGGLFSGTQAVLGLWLSASPGPSCKIWASPCWRLPPGSWYWATRGLGGLESNWSLAPAKNVLTIGPHGPALWASF